MLRIFGPTRRNEEVAGAIRRARGIPTRAARALGCSRRWLRHLLSHLPSARRALEESRGALVGEAASRLAEAIDAGQWKAVRYTLARFGKEQGYGPVRKKRRKRRK